MKSDNEMMLAFQKGDEAAFTILFDKHVKGVLNLLFRYVRDRFIAEDLSQEVFLRLYRYRDKYKPKAKFTTFLYTITTNLALNYIRDNKKRKMAVFSALSANDTSTELSMQIPNPKSYEPSFNLEQEEMQRLVLESLDKLPDNQKIAIHLSKYLDMSHEEIAEVMKITSPAVKSLLSRARDNLRKILQPILDKI